jgi:choline dehydrogenase
MEVELIYISFDLAIIDPRYLSDENGNDRKVLLTGLRVCLEIMRSPAFQKVFEVVPVDDKDFSYWWPFSSAGIEDISDEELVCFMKEKAFTLYHPVGSARMGPSPDSSVVDLQCRVHGVSGLRVMDASIFPEQLSGHPTAPIDAIAFKLSDMIKHGEKRDTSPHAHL